MGTCITLSLDSVVCFYVGVLLFNHIISNWNYKLIQLITKQSVIQHPIADFRTDYGTNLSTNQHNFFYWEGMNKIEDCWCEGYGYDEDGSFFRVEKCKILYDRVYGFNLTIWRNTTFISKILLIIT